VRLGAVLEQAGYTTGVAHAEGAALAALPPSAQFLDEEVLGPRAVDARAGQPGLR
jgi:hypothetical protein